MGRFHLSLVALMVVVISTIASSESQGVFELRLKKFRNDLRTSSGQCCNGFSSSRSGRCTQVCNTRFRVCLKHYQSMIDPNEDCTFGEYFTQPNEKLSDVIQFPLDFKWPRSFSLIIEAWHQDNKTKDSLISRVVTQQQLDAGSSWVHRIQIENRTKLEYDYRMVCSAHYYGKDCYTFCRPRDDRFGHYTCDAEGQKVCLEGWQKDPEDPEGDYCKKAVCLPGCHQEHGECKKPGECKCRPGWTGKHCDECVRYPGCKHGTCSKAYDCNCNSGWGGLFCDQDLNYCTNNNPCHNGATCLNTGQGSYTCSCPPGYTGKNCQTRVTNECSHQPCLNGGTCQVSGSNDYTCVCPIGYDGKHCELTARSCSDSPCKNGAKCLSFPDSIGYRCQCPEGYQGFNCDVKIDHCGTTPCENGGTCIKDLNGGYQCKCPIGFSGPNCQINNDDCAVNPCLNGGECLDFVNDFTCRCPPGFTGKFCEENINDCLPDPCARGTCQDLVNDFTCTCPPGFTGKDCSEEVNECDDSPCMNNGFCINRINDFECKCLPGYSGKACHILPDGTVMEYGKTKASGSKTALIATFATVVPVIVILAVIVLMCNKQRRLRDQRKADAEAKRENELNAVTSVNKSKMLDDHMIVNSLEFPNPKRINANPNIADEELFSAKDSAYKQILGSKKLNTDSSYSKYCDKLLHDDNSSSSSSTSSQRTTNTMMLDRQLLSSSGSNFINRSFNDCASTVSSRSSDSNRSSRGAGASYNSSKKHDLPTAESIQQDVQKASSSGFLIPEHPARLSNYACTEDDLFATEV